MAGVGFSLRALHTEQSYAGLLRLYGAAGVISSGPWLISILTLLLIGAVGRGLVDDVSALARFQVSVTWLFAASLVVSGPIQLAFTRYVADQAYLGEDDLTAPSLLGVILVATLLGGLVCAGLSPFFAGEPLTLRLLLGLGFITLCNSWLVLVVLTSLREHRQVLGAFGLGYAVTFGATLALAPFGETGLLSGFVLGQSVLLLRGLQVVLARLPGRSFVAFGFLERRAVKHELLWVGLFYNLAIWVDKLMFWLSPDTSRQVLGPLRASEVYDLPIFLAYLTIVPGMAVFLVRVETDFAERHEAFYRAIREGAPLRRLERLCSAMADAARRAIVDIVKVQCATLALCFVFGAQLLEFFGISQLHLALFQVDAVGAGLQVLLLAVTSMLFYLDRRAHVARLTLLLLCSNLGLTWLSQHMGPAFYGYGFAVAMCTTSVVALAGLNTTFRDLVRDTFLLQPVST